MDTSRVLMEREPENHAGTNELTPPPKTPEWVKFMVLTRRPFPSISQLELWEDGVSATPSTRFRDGIHQTQDEMTGEFNLLLWAAGVACFVSYGMLPQADNLYLGVVLFCVVTVTGVFSYLQNAKSDNMMNEFKSMRSVAPRFEVLRCLHFVDVTRIMLWVVYFFYFQ